MTLLDDQDLVLTPPPSTVYEKCHWCGHHWHGLACAADDGCTCTSALDTRDDTWRPVLNCSSAKDSARRVMHDTGVDGWVAMRVSTHSITPRFHPNRIRNLLYGSHTTSIPHPRRPGE